MCVYRCFGKRAFDLVLAVSALVILLPLLVVVGILIRLDSPGPVLFVQPRLGQGGRIFNIYKFRTMTHQRRETNREILGRDPEVTKIGYWLRRLKIDELPQLFNVIKGDMSLVGPRPALPDQITEYDEVTKKRLLVRPGMTGLAQVNGNIYLSWTQRWRYDVWYIDNLSFSLDLKIILRTIAVVVCGESKFLQLPIVLEEGRDEEH